MSRNTYKTRCTSEKREQDPETPIERDACLQNEIGRNLGKLFAPPLICRTIRGELISGSLHTFHVVHGASRNYTCKAELCVCVIDGVPEGSKFGAITISLCNEVPAITLKNSLQIVFVMIFAGRATKSHITLTPPIQFALQFHCKFLVRTSVAIHYIKVTSFLKSPSTLIENILLFLLN